MNLLEEDHFLQDLWVQGEVSNVSRPASGHLYFTLKDSASALQCVMWRSAAAKMPLFKEGEAIEAHGSVNIYEAAGKYQLYVDLVRPTGQGRLFQEFLRLKARLETEGLFDNARKRAIPTWPKVIGIVTSPTGAAVKDILNTLKRRYPLAEVILAPTQVQGAEAPDDIVSAIQKLNQVIQPDVIILARGGGSIEDLWAFNDEKVARAIADSMAPIISGIGHETDFTIADFVSDLRAPTPTAAAELATPDQADLSASLIDSWVRLQRGAQSVLAALRYHLEQVENRLARNSPAALIRTGNQRLDDLSRLINMHFEHQNQLTHLRLAGVEQRLALLDPTAILQRGYAIVSLPGGIIVQSTRQVDPGIHLSVQVSDGQFEVQVAHLTGDE